MRKIFLYSVLLITICIGAGSCSKNYLDIGTNNPNQTNKPPLNSLIAYVTNQTSLNFFSASNSTSYFVQYLASSSVAGVADTYDPSIDISTLWANVYYVASNCNVIDSMARLQNAYAHMGVARILKAMNLNLINNMVGDIPYTKALSIANTTPGYDSAEVIYDTCLSLLDQGIALLQKPSPGINIDGSYDLIHSGSATAWLKTAYALKARYLLESSKTARYNPTAILSALKNAYTSNSDDAQATRFQSLNPWHSVAVSNYNLNLDGWLSTNLVNDMNGTTYSLFDPRLPLITDTTKFGDYRGTKNGAGRIGTGTNHEECYLSLGGFYSDTTSAFIIATYSEMKFIQSEVLFNTDKAASYQAYLDGIKANMDKLGVSQSAESAYLADSKVAVGATNFTKDLIFKEKYIATFLSPEAWVDARRYNFAYKNMALPSSANLSEFIRRVPYPVTEISRNAANVPNVTSLAQRLWWDK